MKIKILFSIIAIFLIVSLSIFTHATFAEQLIVQQLTNVVSEKTIFDIDSDRFIWIGGETSGQASEVYLYDGTAVRKVTFDEYTGLVNLEPRIDGDFIVWIKGSWVTGAEVTPQIYIYRISTGETIQATNDQLQKGEAEISDGKVFYLTSEGLKLYDIATGVIVPIDNDLLPGQGGFGSPLAISGNVVVWKQYNPNVGTQIFKKDLSSGLTERLTNNNTNKQYVQASGNDIVWLESDIATGEHDVVLYNGSQIIRVTDNNLDDSHLGLSGNLVVWHFIENSVSKVGIYDISTGTTDMIIDAFHPNTDGNKVVYYRAFNKPEYGTSSNDVFVKDIITGETLQITTDAYGSTNKPFIRGDLVAWAANPNNPTQQSWHNIFIARPGDTPAGNNVVVTESNVTLTYSQVTSGGDTTITTSSSGTQPPSGFKLGNQTIYYNISTTATFSGSFEICIQYDEATIQGSESRLKLMHFVDGQGWVDTTTSLDIVNNIICGQATSFSQFLMVTEPSIQDLINTVEEMNLHQGIENSLDSKLQRAQDAQASEDNNSIGTINALQAFINEVEAQRGNKLTSPQADELHSFANNLIKITQGINIF